MGSIDPAELEKAITELKDARLRIEDDIKHHWRVSHLRKARVTDDQSILYYAHRLGYVVLFYIAIRYIRWLKFEFVEAKKRDDEEMEREFYQNLAKQQQQSTASTPQKQQTRLFSTSSIKLRPFRPFQRSINVYPTFLCRLFKRFPL